MLVRLLRTQTPMGKILNLLNQTLGRARTRDGTGGAIAPCTGLSYEVGAVQESELVNHNLPSYSQGFLH